MSVFYSTRLRLAPAETALAWVAYQRMFSPLARLAVNRHVLLRREFDEIMSDPRIEKHTAIDSAGRIVGMSVVTNRLDRWPLVSPEYFAFHHPDAYASGTIWYVGFVGVLPSRLNVFQGLLESMTAGRRNEGLFYMDFCSFNLQRGIVDLCQRRLAEVDGRVHMQRMDDQSFWLTTFGAGEA